MHIIHVYSINEKTSWVKVGSVTSGRLNAPGSRIQALHYYHSHLYGATLHFLLNTTNRSLKDVRIERIGRGSQGHGFIHDPRFPQGEELHEFRARALAIMLSDGSLEPAGILRYSDDSSSRIDYVRKLFISALGNIDTTVHTYKNKASVLRFPAVVGRVMQQWGMLVGDKFMQSFVLPDEVLNGSVRVKCAYLEEVIPEDGCFGVYRSKPRFRIGRSVVLDAGEKAELYNFTSKISEELREVFTYLATKNPRKKENNTIAHFKLKLTWGKLKEASQSLNQLIPIGKIKKLQKLVHNNPPELLLGERQLLTSLGIKTRLVPMQITQYPTGRLSVSWELMTRGRKEAKKWALLAPPSSGYKQKNVEEWLATYLTRTNQVSVD
jgi:hypothetical protein